MKTQAAIFVAFDKAQVRLAKHDISIHTDGFFGLKFNGKIIFSTDTVDGLTAFADALDFARGAT